MAYPADMCNAWGSVRIEDGTVKLYLDYPEAIARMFAAKKLQLRNPVGLGIVKDGILPICNGGALRLADKPELAALVARGQEMNVALHTERAAKVAIERAADQLLRDEADREAEVYRATIPADHAILEASHDPYAADGWGHTIYRYLGREIPWSLPGMARKMFIAIRPGAMGAFYYRVVASAPRAELASYFAEQERNTAEKSAEPRVPHRGPGTGYCYNCETYCYGDCGDYAPEYGPRQLARDTKEMARELNYGIQD